MLNSESAMLLYILHLKNAVARYPSGSVSEENSWFHQQWKGRPRSETVPISLHEDIC